MKKAIFKGFAVAALALAVLFTGCSNGNVSSIEEKSVDAVEITAKAYPGYNYVCWSIPEKFQSSTVTITRDDGTNLSTTGTRYVVDTDIKDGVKYTYTAYVAVPSTDPVKWQFSGSSVTNLEDVSTEVKGYYWVGNSSSASVKAINPICIKDGKLMKALDLCDYEEGGDSDFVINEDNIVVEFNEVTGKYDIAFPTKEYLTYTTKLYMGNSIETFGLRNAAADETATAVAQGNGKPFISDAVAGQKFYTNDAAVRYNGPVTNAGEYTVVVTVSAVNASYSQSVIKAKNKFTVKALDIPTGTGDVKAGYIDEGKTVRVLWTPAKKADTTLWSEDSYKVYVKDSFGVYTEIAPAKKAKVNEDGEAVEDDDGNVIMETSLPITKGLQKNDDVYYIDYVVPDSKVQYKFYVVLSDGDLYESYTNNSNVETVGAYDDIPSVDYTEVAYNNATSANDTWTVRNAFANIDNDECINDAVLTVRPANSGKATKDLITVTAKYKKIAKSANGSYLGLNGNANELWLDTDFKDDVTATPATDYNRFDFILKNVDYDTEVIWLYKVSQTGKKDKYFAVSANGASAIKDISLANSEVTVSDRTNNANDDENAANPKVTIKVVPDQNNYANYSYAIYYARLDVAAETEGKYATFDNITTWKAGPAVKIAWNKDDLKYEFVQKDFEIPVTTLAAETAATNYADTGAQKALGYSDKYAFKVVKTNTKADANATGNSVVYYSTKTFTKNAK